MTRIMYDSVNAEAIPLSWDPELVAGYVNGKWPSYPAMLSRFPSAEIVSIDVNGTRRDADVLDVETGDATPVIAATWLDEKFQQFGEVGTIYCSSAMVPTVVKACGSRNYHLWVAHYTNDPNHREGVGEVAIQYTDHGPNGENVDISVVLDDNWPNEENDMFTDADRAMLKSVHDLLVGDDVHIQHEGTDLYRIKARLGLPDQPPIGEVIKPITDASCS